MIFTMASTSAYDEDEVHLFITAEAGECIRIGDVISIPMNDHTFEDREITDMYRDWNKWRKGKGLFTEIREGEWAECIVHNIHSGRIHTISSPYDDEILEGEPYCPEIDYMSDYEELQFQIDRYNWDNGFELPRKILQDPECDLSLALYIFYLADGYAYLQGETTENNEWKDFMNALKTKIEVGDYRNTGNPFNNPLSKVQRYKLRKAGIDSVFLEDI